MIDWARRGLEAFEKTPPKTMADILASLNLRPEPDGAVPLASAVAIGKATAAEVLARVEPAKKKGAPKGSQNAAKDREIKGYNVTFNSSKSDESKRGNNRDYLAARLKRDHPAIAARVAAGEFPKEKSRCRNQPSLRPDTAEKRTA